MALAFDSAHSAAAKLSAWIGVSPGSLVSNTFSPGAGSIIVVTSWAGDAYQNDWDATKPTITDSLGTHLTWNLVASAFSNSVGATSERTAVWWAYTASAQTNMTVTVTEACTGGQYITYMANAADVWTGADTTTVIGAVSSGATDSGTSLSKSINPTAVGSALMLAAGHRAATVSAGTNCYLHGSVATQVFAGNIWYGTSGGPTLTTDTSSKTLAASSGTTGSWQWIAYEVLAPSGSGVSLTPTAISAQATIPTPSFPNASVTPSAISAHATVPTPTAGSGTPYIVGLAGGGTGYFVDQYNNPRLVWGDENWGLPANAGRWNSNNWQGAYDDYLNARAAQGINVVYTHPYGATITGGVYNDGRTYDGVYPFVGGDPGSLNDTFWQRIDYFLSKAASLGITVFLNIGYSYDIATGACLNGKTNTQWQNYGAALAARYASVPNIVWIFGDDYYDGYTAQYTACRTGLRGAGDTHVMTVQNMLESTSRKTLNGSSCTWGTSYAEFNFVYQQEVEYFGVEYAYNESSPIPVLQGDGYFYQNTGGNYSSTYDRAFRQEAWWALSSGSRGKVSGDDNIWQWPSGGQNQVGAWWWANNSKNIVDAFTALTGWQNLLPDTSSQLVTSGRGTRATYTTNQYEPATTDAYVTASRTSDGSLAVIYLSHATTIGIDQTKVGGAGNYTAKKIDPVTGAATTVTAGSSYNSSTWGNNSRGEADWVLVLQASAASASITATAISATANVPTPGVVASVVKTATAVSATASIPTPGIIASTVKTATAVSATASIPVPAASSNVGITATAVGTTSSIPTPAVTAIRNVSITATAVSGTALVPAPSITAVNNVAITASAVTASASIPAPAVTTTASVTASAVVGSASIPTPSIQSNVLKAYVGTGGSSGISGSWLTLVNAEGSASGDYATWTAV